jgi:hypothetical protein
VEESLEPRSLRSAWPAQVKSHLKTKQSKTHTNTKNQSLSHIFRVYLIFPVLLTSLASCPTPSCSPTLAIITSLQQLKPTKACSSEPLHLLTATSAFPQISARLACSTCKTLPNTTFSARLSLDA